MQNEEFGDLIKKVKEHYKKIVSIESPAFGNEKIYFNHYGFDHLIMKQRKYRTSEEIKRRFRLMDDVTYILHKTTTIFSEERRLKGTSTAYFWTIKKEVNNRMIRSIMQENTKPPEGGL